MLPAMHGARLRVKHVLLVLVLCARSSTAAEESDATCSAADPSCTPSAGKVTDAGSYYWPMAMGHPNYYSNPPWPGPTDLQSSFAWKWFGPTNTQFEESFVAAVIDDKKDIYVTGDYYIYKLSPDGALLWTYKMPGRTAADGPVIYKGRLNGATAAGWIFSVDMETGREVWTTKASDHDGGEYSHLAAHKGVVVTQGDKRCQTIPWHACASARARGLNVTDGQVLWMYDPDEVLWDWFPQFPDDESVIFMDKTGALHKLELQTGKLIWKAGGTPYTWTDGSQFMASNGLTYTVEVSNDKCKRRPFHVTDCEGYITAFKTSDGSKVWQATVPKPPNTSPVVGRIGKGDRLTLIMGIGQQSQDGCGPPAGKYTPSFLGQTVQATVFGFLHTFSVWLGENNRWLWGSMTRTHDVCALDAETGTPIWRWEGPTSHRMMNRGDEDGWIPRFMRGLRTVCCPTPWGQPRIDSAGTIYIANENGDFFALRDANGDSKIDPEKEVSVFHTGATFPHCGSAHAPGLMVAVNFDGVFVWKW